MSQISLIIPLTLGSENFAHYSPDLAKPLIRVDGEPMFQKSLRSLFNLPHKSFTFLIHRPYWEQLEAPVRESFPDATLVAIETESRGTLATIKAASAHLPKEGNVLVMVPDFYFEAPSFLEALIRNNDNSSELVVLTHRHIKNSVDPSAVCEGSRLIAINGKLGQGHDDLAPCVFFRDAKTLQTVDQETCNELGPFLNHLIEKGATVKAHYARHYFSFRTPRELLHYQGRYGQGFQSLREFYPYYISEHIQPGTKLLHFIGSALALVLFLTGLFTMNLKYVLMAMVAGYGPAWIAHFFIERNRPATFKYPTYSLASDFILFFELLTGKRKFFEVERI
jgi:GTP:adenosylcobinamide-phosphate guanylyltransferase